jgi:hypothetical protein
MVSFEGESFLHAPVAGSARPQTFCRQNSEIPRDELRTDLLTFSGRLELTVAAELKLRNRTQAVRPYLPDPLRANRVFIALPVHAARRVDTNIPRAQGIGLSRIETAGCCQPNLTSARSTVEPPEDRVESVELLCKGA